MKNAKEKVVIYVRQYCPFCKEAKELLDKKGVEYKEIDVIENSDLFDDIKLKYNVGTVPQIFVNDENGNYMYHIAGCDKLINLEREGKLDYILNNNKDYVGVTAYTDSNCECEEYVIPPDDNFM
ncbi:glutaredoxin family protein [Wolbachia endosymbiont of Onchocerca gibsoni]|uniref:glutaredoxin domain-containing protein n=1 Tax=Wolbachia endosymbiont of Onchocerca gibsoni TaxID=118986 RepID=UPI0023D81FCD|nr:glutaredoxin domain-containing protein [Wolbachia endosymbiont of Onchocerca gibsoni]MDF0607334.1 glutaredoxin family protein [Wolbachia endosymbiont of Onchocerca gibsoni]